MVLDYNDLVAGVDLTDSIEAAFGLSGLGLLCVKNVPNFLELRNKILPMSSRYCLLPMSVKEKTMANTMRNRFLPGWGEWIGEQFALSQHFFFFYSTVTNIILPM